jgi:hypothetical protein
MFDEDAYKHLSGSAQWYWRMRSAYEEQITKAGGSVQGLAIATGLGLSSSARSANRMGIIAGWEQAAIATPPYLASEDDHGPRLRSIIQGISDRSYRDLLPIDAEPGRFDGVLGLIDQGCEGKLDTTKDFKALIVGCERAIIGVQPDHISDGEAREGHHALRHFSLTLMRQHPHIRDEMTAEVNKDRDRLLNALTDEEIDRDQMNILRMSSGLKMHPAEVTGMAIATGLIPSDDERIMDRMFSDRARSDMASASQRSPVDVAKEVVDTISDDCLDKSARIAFAAHRKRIDEGIVTSTTAVELDQIAGRSQMDIDSRDHVTNLLHGLQANIIERQLSRPQEKSNQHEVR